MKKLMLLKISKQNPGITSLLIVLAIGLVLSTMVAGIALVAVREQQQSSNVEQSSKAFQAAESGVKFLSQEVSKNPNYTVTDQCPLDTAKQSYAGIQSINDKLDSSGNLSLTCVEVKQVFEGAYEGQLDADRSAMFLAGPINTDAPKAPYYMMLKWHDKAINGILQEYTTSAFYPSAYTDRAATIEMTFIYWKNGSINPKAIAGDRIKNVRVATMLVTPGNKDQGYSNYAGRAPFAVNSSCDPAQPTYVCSLTPSGSAKGFKIPPAIGEGQFTEGSLTADQAYASYNLAIIIKPRYRNTNYELQLYNSDGTSLTKFKSTKTQIDVTAKSANLYRRVKAEVPSSLSTIENVFDTAIFSGRGNNDNSNNDICKQIVVKSQDNTLIRTGCETSWQQP